MGRNAGLVRDLLLLLLIKTALMLTSWMMLKYPIPKAVRIALVKVYLELATLPGMPTHIVATCSDALGALTKSRVRCMSLSGFMRSLLTPSTRNQKKLTVKDMRLPWRCIYIILEKDLFLNRRQFEITCVLYARFMASDQGLINACS